MQKITIYIYSRCSIHASITKDTQIENVYTWRSDSVKLETHMYISVVTRVVCWYLCVLQNDWRWPERLLEPVCTYQKSRLIGILTRSAKSVTCHPSTLSEVGWLTSMATVSCVGSTEASATELSAIDTPEFCHRSYRICRDIKSLKQYSITKDF